MKTSNAEKIQVSQMKESNKKNKSLNNMDWKHYQTLEDARYKYCLDLKNGEHLIKTPENKLEVFFECENTASSAYIWNETQLEYKKDFRSSEYPHIKIDSLRIS